MIRKPDYKKAIFEADNILLGSNQFELPLNIEKLIVGIKTLNINIVKFSDTGVDNSKELKVSGFVKEKGGMYYVFYNDFIESTGHIRFTLLHELGHIFLGHDLSLADDFIQEREADIFATELLMPEAIIHELINREFNITDEVSLDKLFNASHKACQIRIEEFTKLPEWHSRYTDYDSIVNIQFKNYLDSFFPYKKNKYYDDIDEEIEEERNRDKWR